MGTLVNGIKEIFATAKTTGSNVMLCGNDGTPDGHMTMANLASVLGVFKNGGRISNIDTLFDEGYYSSWSDSFGFYIVLVYKSADGKTLQFYISTQETKYRYSTDNSTWQSWNVLSYPIELRNYTTLSSLANALGVRHYQERGTLTIPRGYGLIYTWNVSLGDFVLCAVGRGNVVTELAKAGTNLTITKPTEYQTQISCSSSSHDVNAIFIGFA